MGKTNFAYLNFIFHTEITLNNTSEKCQKVLAIY